MTIVVERVVKETTFHFFSGESTTNVHAHFLPKRMWQKNEIFFNFKMEKKYECALFARKNSDSNSFMCWKILNNQLLEQ